MDTTTRQPSGRTYALLAAFIATTAILAAILISGSASAASMVKLGVTAPAPACPAHCEAVGRVTGFQTLASGKNPSKVPKNGKIVQWTIRLSKPNDKQLSFFNAFYGKPPKARLAILRQSSTKKTRYRLLRHSPTEEMRPSYMSAGSQTFILDQPLAVKRNDIVALSIPTWVPAFANNVSDKNTWRASRSRGKCTARADIKGGSAQQSVGGTRTYGCSYKGARLLYAAGFISN